MEKSIHTLLPSTFWCGVDVAKLTFVASIWGHLALLQRRTRQFPRTHEGARKLLEWLRQESIPGCRLALVMEATGRMAIDLAAHLLELDSSLHIAIVNPRRVSHYIASLGLRNKTDELDACALAGFGHERAPEAWQPLTSERNQLQEMVRTRALLVSQRTALLLSLRDHNRNSTTATQALTNIIASMGDAISEIEMAMAEHVAQHPNLNHAVKLMTSIKGIGLITALTVIAEIGDLSVFLRSRSLSAFAGLSPRRKDSGTSVRGRTRMCKQGSAMLRACLYMAAKAAVRFNPDMAQIHQRMMATGHHYRSALGCVMRKLLILMRAVVLSGTAWKPQIEFKAQKTA